MKDEIKEILDKPKILMLSYGNYISLDDYVKLKDYITNLQEENGKLKEFKNFYREKFISNFCEKNRAIEYIKNNIADIEFIKKQYNVVIYDDYVETTINDIEKLLNILQGEDKEQLYKYTPEKGFRLVGDIDE